MGGNQGREKNEGVGEKQEWSEAEEEQQRT